MWGGSKVPPSRPLRTGTRIGISASRRRTSAGSGPTGVRGEGGDTGGSGHRLRRSCKATGRRIARRAAPRSAGRHRHGRPRTSRSPFPAQPRRPRLDKDLGEERNGRPQSAPVIDRHRPHAGHDPGEGNRPLPAGADRAAIGCRQVDPPMPSKRPAGANGDTTRPGTGACRQNRTASSTIMSTSPLPPAQSINICRPREAPCPGPVRMGVR